MELEGLTVNNVASNPFAVAHFDERPELGVPYR